MNTSRITSKLFIVMANNYSSSSIDKLYCIATAIFLIAMGSLSTILNVLALKFFMKKNSIFNLVSKWATLTDLATLGASLPVMVSYSSYRSPVMFANPTFCAGWHVIWRVITRFSLHLVGLLSVTRTITICYSLLRPLKISMIKAGMAVDILAVSAAIIWSFLLDTNIVYFKMPVFCVAFNQMSTSRNIMLDLFLVFVPFLVMAVSYTISLFKLVKDRGQLHKANRLLDLTGRRMQSGVTILAVTAMCIVGSMVMFEMLQSGHQGGSSLPRQLYYYNYILVTSYMLNSVANPLIYVWRLRDFRAYLVNIKEQSLARWRIFQIAEEEQVLERARSTERNQSNIAVSTSLSNIAVSTPLSSIAESTPLSNIAESTQFVGCINTIIKHSCINTIIKHS